MTDTRGDWFCAGSGDVVAGGSAIHEAIVRELALVAGWRASPEEST